MSQEDIALHGKIMKSIKIWQNCQQSATFLNAKLSENHWKLLQVHVTENGKCYIIYYVTTYLLHVFFIFLLVIFLKDCHFSQN